jgi:hypothetical protein
VGRQQTPGEPGAPVLGSAGRGKDGGPPAIGLQTLRCTLSWSPSLTAARTQGRNGLTGEIPGLTPEESTTCGAELNEGAAWLLAGQPAGRKAGSLQVPPDAANIGDSTPLDA